MNILFVTSRPLEINTSSSIRNRAYVNGLLELGHSINVVSISSNKNHDKYEELNKSSTESIRFTYINPGTLGKIKSLGQSNVFFKKIRKIGALIYQKFSLFETSNAVMKSVSNLRIMIKDYDLIISSSDPKSSHELVNNILKDGKVKVPWVQIWGDPFFSDISRKKNVFLDKKIKIKEKELLKIADKIIYVSHLTLENQKNLFPDFSSKMIYLPTPYLKKEIYAKKLNSSKINFVYTGDFNSNIRDILPLYEAFKNSKHYLSIYGDSNVNLKETKNIKIFKRVNSTEIKEVIKNNDILIHLSNIKGNQIPGKIFHYSATNKPILFITEGDGEKIKLEFEKYNRYIFCENKLAIIGNSIDTISEQFRNYNYKPVEDFSPTKIVDGILNSLD